MQFRTKIDIPKADFELMPYERMLFVGSCFADSMGQRFKEELFRAEVNPFGVMYNPVSIRHTVERYEGAAPRTAVFTLGTNHVYVDRARGVVVDNCEKRPAREFEERELSVEECAAALREAIGRLVELNPEVRVVLTVSPIRYRKYGYHRSQLSKAVLLLAADTLVSEQPERVNYFPAYELLNDELRDYRFYAPDMLHPSPQAVDYIYERFAETYFGEVLRQFLAEWEPIRQAKAHRPLHPETAEYQAFREKTVELEARFAEHYAVYRD